MNARDPLNWQKKLAQGFTSVADLLHYLELPLDVGSNEAETHFSTRIPLGFAQRMEKGNANDPLLMQVLASSKELESMEGYGIDPLDELQKNPSKGLIHKYHGRVLLTLTGVCAVNCRFCFRRHFPYAENNPGRGGWQETLDYIRADNSITEVIISGGDPLLATDRVMEELLNILESIQHVHTLRIHTRIPIVFPERIDQGFISVLSASRLHKVIVLHSNHPNELDSSVQTACMDLKKIGCVLLNQSVLLEGINDDPKTLAKLSQALFAYGVLPYYLHVLDQVKGAAHFDMPFSKAQKIFRDLQALLPGYLVPRLAREESGKANKTLLI